MPGVDRIRSALIYEYPVDRLVAMTKYRDRLDGAQLLGDLLETYLLARISEGGLDQPDLILPVPLHRFRLAYRGFNQALEIALPVATGLGIPMRADLCRRTRHTREQATLTGRARYRNTYGAFDVAKPLPGKHLAIVDDVVTTGSTVVAMAATLRAAGASTIQVWSVARTHRMTSRDSLKSVVEQNTGK
jgi:ComF family protein